MRFPDWMQRRRLTLPLSIAAFSTLALLLANAAEPPLNRTLAQRNWLPDPKPVKKHAWSIWAGPKSVQK